MRRPSRPIPRDCHPECVRIAILLRLTCVSPPDGVAFSITRLGALSLGVDRAVEERFQVAQARPLVMEFDFDPAQRAEDFFDLAVEVLLVHSGDVPAGIRQLTTLTDATFAVHVSDAQQNLCASLP